VVRTLGNHIRRRRLDLGLWQRILAKQLGVREETLATWERGQAKPLARHYGAIVRFLGYDPHTADDSLAARLRAVRRRLGLTQEQLAAQAGLDEGTIVDLEMDRRSPSQRTRQKIEALLRPKEEEVFKSSG
jgi:DNA-binding XRE family transcriptional regulator